ncbi:MAG TPA: exodeoxyribonuclease V subunit alpha [Chitinispirillaceae bacterium]|nr:exodeoxyribonuclease V subunit alpha [Chitinispirillaceae bacterium]
MKQTGTITFEHFDHYFAEFLNSLTSSPCQAVYCAAALASNLLREGHIWCNLSEFADKIYVTTDKPDTENRFPALNSWLEDLSRSEVTGSSGEYKPLILEYESICLYRYWNYELQAAEMIKKIGGYKHPQFPSPVIEQCVRAITGESPLDHYQYDAVLSAVHNSFTVITGGPGTGKTTTVARIVAVLRLLYTDRPFRIALAAPTGKAAMRLGESLKHALASFSLDNNIRDHFSAETQTIHRLLGTIPGSIYFRYNRQHPLPFDLVIIDEASMVDISLMAKLLEAIPAGCRLILLGDKDQLASVEAGSVLADICKIAEHSATPDAYQSPDISRESPISLITLKKSFRFQKDSGIGQLAESINNGLVESVFSTLSTGNQCHFTHIPDSTTLRRELVAQSKQWFDQLLTAKEPDTALDLLYQFRILTTLRHGAWGAESINNVMKECCKSTFYWHDASLLFDGMPIMVTTNDYRNELFNGDTGVIFWQSSQYYAFFKDRTDAIRSIPLRSIASWEPSFAITVHKSQGSEFSNTVFVLPPLDTPLLSRELIYTAVTRSRTSISILGTEPVLKAGITRSTKRCSGLQKWFISEPVSPQQVTF